MTSLARPALALPRIASATVLVTGGFLAAVAVLLLTGEGAVLRLAYPGLALVACVWLWSARGFPSYLGFASLLWFISPGIRRIVDYQAGSWDSANPISLTPLLASALAFAVVLRRLPATRRWRFVPWLAAIVALVFGFISGVLQGGLYPAAFALLTWMAPLGLGLAIALEWRRYPQIAESVANSFWWGTLVVAGYGLCQFVTPSAWDRLWVDSTGMLSVGQALPFKLRVFSLVNSPLACATLMLCGFLLTFSRRERWRQVLLPLSGAVLLLTLVRSVWLVALVALLVFLVALPMRAMRRTALAGLGVVAVLLLVPLALSENVRDTVVSTVTKRANTLGDLHGDLSYESRMTFTDGIGQVVLEHPLGYGLGSTGVSSVLATPSTGIRDFDNGILAVIYSLGWFGGVAFLSCAALIVGMGFARRESSADLVAKAARAIVVASLLLSLGGNVFEGFSAMIFWVFAGVLMASQTWHRSPAPSLHHVRHV